MTYCKRKDCIHYDVCAYKACKFVCPYYACNTYDRPQGEWIENSKTFRWECSMCKKSTLYNKVGVQIKSKFCSNCGAKMKGGAENEKTGM